METNTTTTHITSFESLNNFLSYHKISKEVKSETHVSQLGGKFLVEDEDQFMKLYCKSVEKNEIISVNEKPNEYVPLRFDLDLKFKNRKKYLQRQYSVFHIQKIIEPIHKYFFGIINKPEKNPELFYCCVLQRPEPYIDLKNDKFIKDGIHLHFPYFVVDKPTHKYITEKLKPHIEHIFSDLELIDNKKIVDDITDKHWTMYGSINKENIPPYQITKYFHYDFESLVKRTEIIKDVTLFFARDMPKKKEKDIVRKLPMLLSIRRYTKKEECTKIKREFRIEVQSSFKAKEKKKITREKVEVDDEQIDKNLDEAQKVLDIVSDERADDYNTWMEAGWTLYSIGEGCNKALDMWIEFSQRSDKFKDSECEMQWKKMKVGDKTIGTFKKWAKEDNEEAYNELYPKKKINEKRLVKKKTMFDKVPLKAKFTPEYEKVIIDLKREDQGQCDIFVREQKDNIVIIDEKGNGYIWNEKTKLWEESHADMIKNKISPCLEKICEDVLCYLKNSKETGLSDEDAQVLIYELFGIQKRILTTRTSSAIFTKVKTELYDPLFVSKLNTKPDLIPIKHGKVIEMRRKQKYIVRDRTKEDMCSFICPVYIDISDEDLKKVDEFMLVFANNDKKYKRFLQKLFGYFMTGHMDRFFWCFWGGGSNGKSAVFNLLRKVTGRFYVAASKDVFIKSDNENLRRTGAATPHLVPLIGARIAVHSESESKEILNTTTIKNISGGDPIYCRPLYAAGFDFICQAKPILLTNFKPEFNIRDGAFVDRYRLLPCLARIVDNPDTSKGEFQRDTDLVDSMMNELLDAFFVWCLKGCERWYKNKKLILPEVAQKETSKHLDELDTAGTFIRTACSRENEEVKISQSVLYSSYTSWCSDKDVNAVPYNSFGQFLKNQNITIKREKTGRFVYGIKINPDIENPNDDTYNNDFVS